MKMLTPQFRVDFENHFNKMVSEDEKYFTHTLLKDRMI